jgi:hypothetical protein
MWGVNRQLRAQAARDAILHDTQRLDEREARLRGAYAKVLRAADLMQSAIDELGWYPKGHPWQSEVSYPTYSDTVMRGAMGGVSGTQTVYHDDGDYSRVSELVEKAQTTNPKTLRQLARRALEVVEAEQAAVDAHEKALARAEEDVARSKTRLTLHDNDDGTTSGHFTVPTLQASMLRKILDSMTAPRRARLGATAAQAGSTAPTGRAPGDSRSPSCSSTYPPTTSTARFPPPSW